jgi:ABC-type microcin C transport system duplicated ATPase subunit YejF
MTVEQIVGEPLVVHSAATGKEVHDRVEHLLETVGLNPALVCSAPK